jgi:hypothetical protein
MEQYIYKLTNKMAKFIPGFRVNVSFRTVKVISWAICEDFLSFSFLIFVLKGGERK